MTVVRSWGDGDGRGVALHDRTADRLLAGTLDPDDVPPGYEGVAELVRVATGPATADELRDEGAAVVPLVGALPAAPPSRPTPAGTPSTTPPVTPPLVSTGVQPVAAVTPSAGGWRGRWTRAAAVAVVVLMAAGGGLATLQGGDERPPAISADPSPDRDRTATIQGTQGPPLSEPTTTVPTTVVRPPAPTPPAISPPGPPAAEAPAAPPAPAAPAAPVTSPPATGTPPTTAPPLPEECADIERLPAGMREGLDQMARGFGFPSFAEMCRVGAQYSSWTSSGPGAFDWWSGSSSRPR